MAAESVKFVAEVPAPRRGRPVSPEVVKARKILDENKGKGWGAILTGATQSDASKFAKSVSKDSGYEATVRQGEDDTYTVYARAV